MTLISLMASIAALAFGGLAFAYSFQTNVQRGGNEALQRNALRAFIAAEVSRQSKRIAAQMRARIFQRRRK